MGSGRSGVSKRARSSRRYSCMPILICHSGPYQVGRQTIRATSSLCYLVHHRTRNLFITNDLESGESR